MSMLPTTKRSYWTTWLATLLFFAAFYTLLVPLPLYLAAIELPDWQIGLILGAFGIASLIGRPLAGVFTDQWGYRPVVLFGTGALAVGALGVSLTAWPPFLFLLRLLQAAGYVAFTTAATALISELAPAARRGAALALFGVAANVAMTLVPASVSAMLDSLTLGGAFWLCGGLAVAGGLLVWRVIPKPPDRRAALVWRGLLQFPAVLRQPMLTTALFGLGFGAFFQFLPLLAERRGLEPVGLAYTVYGLAIILTRLVTGRLLDRPDRTQVLYPAFVLLALGLGWFAITDTRWTLLGAAALVAAGSGVLHPTLIAIHVDALTEAERGKASAGFYLAFDLGIGLGTWILSPAFEHFGLAGLFLLAAGFSLAGLVSVRAIDATATNVAARGIHPAKS